MTYRVTIMSSDGNENTYACAGSNDQEALIYAGKVIEEKADASDPDAAVMITNDGEHIGPAISVDEMLKRAV